MTLLDLRDLLLTVGVPVYHFEAGKEEGNYIVWGEEGQASASSADNRMRTQGIRGTIEYFTTVEFDPVFDLIQEKLNSTDMAWGLDDIGKKPGEKYIRYLWSWEILNEFE
jgi:hypothetical protein